MGLLGLGAEMGIRRDISKWNRKGVWEMLSRESGREGGALDMFLQSLFVGVGMIGMAISTEPLLGLSSFF